MCPSLLDLMVWSKACDLDVDESPERHDNLYLCIPLVVQGIFQNLFATDWAMHVVDHFAKVAVQKANPTLRNPLSSVSTRNILCDSTSVHVLRCQPDAHVQSALVSSLNKIRQT